MARLETASSSGALNPLGAVWTQRSAEAVRAYLALTKPRIVSLLVVTTLPAMMLANRAMPSLGLIVVTLVGGMLTAGCANALNQVLETDIDSRMNRTSSRPLVSGRISKLSAVVFATTIGFLGAALLWLVVNPLASILAVSAIAFYIGVYTLGLKRRTPQNIVIGGAAGAMPALVGWAAITGDLALPAWMMFMIIFLWTPPHFWALALKYSSDYRSAGIPMLPVVKGVRRTVIEMVAYSFVMAFCAVALVFVSDLGPIYFVVSVLLGAEFVRRALVLIRRPAKSMALFGFSIVYLAGIFAAIGVDALV